MASCLFNAKQRTYQDTLHLAKSHDAGFFLQFTYVQCSNVSIAIFMSSFNFVFRVYQFILS